MWKATRLRGLGAAVTFVGLIAGTVNGLGNWAVLACLERGARASVAIPLTGLAEMVNALREKRQPLHSLAHDIHLIEVIEASSRAAKEKRAMVVQSHFRPLDLRLQERKHRHHLHDHTRPTDDQ